MRNSYKIKTNYYNNRNIPFDRKSPSALKTDPSYYNQDILRKDKNYISSNQGINHLFSKVLSKKKRRGVLDMSSPGNKDVLTDTDSEIPDSKNSSSMELINKNMHRKNGCAKLIIEKIESQGPQRNEEYYKFTNQKRYSNINDRFNSLLRVNPPSNQMSINSYNNIRYKNFANSINYNNSSQFIDYNNENGYKSYKPGKVMEKPYLDISNSNLNTNYKKTNYSHNKNLTTSNKDRYNYSINDSNYDKNFNSNYIGNSYIDQNRSYFPNRSPFLHKSTESSAEKISNSNFIGYKNNNNIRNVYYENDLSTPTFSNNDDSYPSKRTLALKKNLAPNNRQQKTISLYNNYKDLIKRPTINQLINISNNSNNNNTYLQNRFNEKLLKSIIKIQSFWRGAFIRELMTFVEKLNSFIDTLSRIFQNQKRKQFYYLINLLKNLEKPPKNKKISVGLNMKGSSMRHKYILSKDKIDSSTILKNIEKIEKKKKQELDDNAKDEKYNNLLQNYNSLMDKYNKLKEELSQNNQKNKFNNLDIDKNNLEIIDKIKKTFNKLNGKNNKNKEDKSDDNGITKAEEIKKKFDIIKPGQKEEFNIISTNNNNIRLRGKNNNKKIIYQIEKIFQIHLQDETNRNHEDNGIKYEGYLNHFKLNLEINNNDSFIIDETKNIKEKILDKVPFDISNNNSTLINEENKENMKEKILNKISFDISNSSFALINEVNKENVEEKEEKQKKFENISINKNENGELTLINNTNKKEEPIPETKEVPNTEVKEEKSEPKKKTKSKRRKKKDKKQPESIAESQENLNNEIKGLEEEKQKSSKDFTIHNNNKIDIIQSGKNKEFDKEKISPKNDILINIISDKKDSDINNNDKPKDIIEEKKKEFVVEKNEDILLSEEKDKNKKLVEIFMIDNNNILYIKRKKKMKCDKITEITEELNKIEPHNHYELVFKGKININDKDISQEEKEINPKNQSEKVNYNKENEVQKREGIEINPLEFKKENPNNIIISYDDKIEVLYNKNSPTFTEKAKRNMMKIILPIRLKTVLKGYIRRTICPLIIKRAGACK